MRFVRSLVLLALYACLAFPLASAQARRVPAVGQDLEAAIATARVGGKYQGLLRVLRVEEDLATYGRFKDYGHWKGGAYRGNAHLPEGYWVWVAPHWFIWERSMAVGFGTARQALGPPDCGVGEGGSFAGAWMPGLKGARGLAWLELDYERPVPGQSRRDLCRETRSDHPRGRVRRKGRADGTRPGRSGWVPSEQHFRGDSGGGSVRPDRQAEALPESPAGARPGRGRRRRSSG